MATSSPENPKPQSREEASAAHSALVWCDASQTLLITHALEAAGIEKAYFGSPTGTGGTIDDLRLAIAKLPEAVKLIVLASPSSSGQSQTSLHEDDDALDALRAKGVAVVSLEPPTTITQAAREDTTGVEALRIAPLMRDAPVWPSVLESLENVGTIRGVQVSIAADRRTGTLWAHLFDAMACVYELLGLPERIDASIASAEHTTIPERPTAITGWLGAHLRFAAGHVSTVWVKEQLQPQDQLEDLATDVAFSRIISIEGDQGTLTANDAGTAFWDVSDVLQDESENAHSSLFCEQLAHTLKNVISKRALSQPPLKRGRVIAMCQAAILSARTRQPESPQALLDAPRV